MSNGTQQLNTVSKAIKLTYRGIAYTTNHTVIQTTTKAQYRGQTYTTTHTPEASTAKTLTYRGISYNSGNGAVSQPSVSTVSANNILVFN